MELGGAPATDVSLCLRFSDGKFGARMQVHIQNDGPVTIELVSPSGPADPKMVRGRYFMSARQFVM